MPDLKTNPSTTLRTGVLYYGDNLEILRGHIPAESVDLIYLDPPFNSQQQYNVLFKEPTGQGSTAQIRAFTDTWHWDMAAEKTYQDIIVNTPMKVSKAVEALRSFIGANDVMAYLVMMTLRLVELHRVLKSTGSLYLHCDPTASHYLKVILDTIFGPRNFKNEIVWRRTNAHSNDRVYGRIHDVLLFYAKTDSYAFSPQTRPYLKGYVDSMFRQRDERGVYRHADPTAPETRTGDSGQPWQGYDPTKAGRHWAIPAYLREDLERHGEVLTNLTSQEKLDLALSHGLIYLPDKSGGQPAIKRYLTDRDGTKLQDIWAYQPYTENLLFGTGEAIDQDVKWLQSEERLGYETQKPEGLLDRVISASSNEGDVVLDPFCGCGTAIIAAQKLNRRWIGIDVTHLAITVMRKRLEDSFPGIEYEVVGEPKDLEGAKALARQDRYQFQWWALSLVNALPQGGERKKGADEGIDGVISFVDDRKGKARRVIVQVKSGHVGVRDIRELKAVIGDENLGLFITLEPPTEPMRVEAATAGFHSSPLWERDFPRIQIFTVAELLDGKPPDLPLSTVRDFARAPKIGRRPTQITLQVVSAE